MKKAIVATWLFKTDLSNLNAGEGSTNLKEIKTYQNGLPYISGQSVRHALRKAIQREHPDVYKCTVEYPCGNIGKCWLCDIFGYMLPKGSKRWSPVKVSPALGQVRNSITSDLILRLVNDIECPECKGKINPFSARKGDDDDEKKKDKKIDVGKELECPICKKKFKAPYDIRQALAYKQLIANTYRVGLSIDIQALGVEEVPEISGQGKDSKITGIKYKRAYADEDKERKTRVKAILNGISNISDFASISREMTNTNPDIILLSYQNNYNNRLTSALEMDEQGQIDVARFKVVIEDCLAMEDAKIYAGFIPSTVAYQDQAVQTLKDLENAKDQKGSKVSVSENPRKAILKLITDLSNGGSK